MKEKKKKEIWEFIKKNKIKILLGVGSIVVASFGGKKIIRAIKSPTCNFCGGKMTEFDGWAWHTCPKCGNSVRIIDGQEDWYSDVYREGTKQIGSDFAAANFCRGWDLTED